jgi:hypothetical protein
MCGARVIGAMAVVSLLLWGAGAPADEIVDDFEVPVAEEEEEEVVAVEEPCPECQVPNAGRVGFNMGFDVTDKYYFRGMRQQDRGFIGQPWANVSVSLYEGDGALSHVALHAGTWNSVHSRDQTDSGPDNWYEADLYGGLTVGLWDLLEVGVGNTSYLSPNDSFDSVHEVAFSLGFDDSEWLGDFALNPQLLWAIETQGTRFGASPHLVPDPSTPGAEIPSATTGTPNKGTYMQISAGPEVPLWKGDNPITLSVPLILGLSLDDYYETLDTSQPSGKQNPTYGYFQTGMMFGIPLAFVPAEYGSWKLSAGWQVFQFGTTTRKVNRNQDNQTFLGIGGISMSY